MAKSQTIQVDEIAEDSEELQKKLEEITGLALTLESKDTTAEKFLVIEPQIRAVLVKKKGAPGAFRVTGGELHKMHNIVTGPQENGAVIVLINEGQTGMCIGQPSFRRFKEA